MFLNFTMFVPKITNFSVKFIKYMKPQYLSWNKYQFYSTNSDLKPDVKQLLDNAALFENEKDSMWATSPYPKGARLQYNHALRPRIDPRETSLILFPGEGSQFVGMGHHLLMFDVVKDIFDSANEILNYDLLSLCLKGPKSKLDETRHAQVAVMVCSFAALEKLREERPSVVDSCMATAGFGIGELTALTFAGAISFERGRCKIFSIAYNKFGPNLKSVTCTNKPSHAKLSFGLFHLNTVLTS